MTWVSLALALLKLVNSIMDWAKKNGYINEGKRLAFAEEAARLDAIIEVTRAAQKEPDTWDDQKLDDFLSKP
jgi:hypothetical protein